MTTTKQKIIELAKGHPGIVPREVVKHVGCSDRYARTVLREIGVEPGAAGNPRKQEPPMFPDYHVPEDVDWREWFANWDEQNEMHIKIDPRQNMLTIRIPAEQDIVVVSTSDLHLGGGFTDHVALRTTLEYILKTPGMYLWIAGDSMEGFLPGVHPAETMEQQPASIRAQIDAFTNIVDELVAAGKLLFCTWGDHDGKWFEQSIGFNVLKPMIDAKVPYFMSRGLIKFYVGEELYYILVNHGERFSSQYSHTHPQRRAYDQYFPADVIVGGHKHHPEWRVMWHYQQLREAGLPVGGKTILVANGTFKSGPDTYSCRYWEHGIMGTPSLTFSPNGHEFDIFEGPRKAYQYVLGQEAEA